MKYAQQSMMGAKDMGTLYGGQSGVQGESLPGREGNVIDQDQKEEVHGVHSGQGQLAGGSDLSTVYSTLPSGR